MVITNDFVFLHLPKTGGTFCETHIMRLYRQSHRERLTNIFQRKPVRWGRAMRKHFGFHAIPRYAQHLPKVSCIRNPYDRWVSNYEFKIYKYYPEEVPNLNHIKAEYPHFPDVSLTEFIKLSNKYFTRVQNRLGKTEEEKIGLYSEQFIGMYCHKPGEILNLPKEEITAELVRSRMAPDITFLQTHNLNQELHDFLAQYNHDPVGLKAILKSPKILPEKSGPGSLRPKGAWRSYYTTEAVEIVNDKEALIFELFPQFKIETYSSTWSKFLEEKPVI